MLLEARNQSKGSP